VVNPNTGAKLYLADDAYLFYNNQIAEGLVDGFDFVGAEFVAVLDDDGDIASLIATEWDDSIFVTKTRETYYQVYGRDEGATTQKFDLDDDFDAYVVAKDGVLGDIEDIAVEDVVHYYEVTNDGDFVWMQVVSDSVSGELEEVATDADEYIILDVDGEEYVVGTGTYSTDNNLYSWDVHEDETTFLPFIGEEVTLYLDKDGYVRHVAGDVEPAAADVFAGVVSNVFYDVTSPDPTEPVSYYLKVFTTEDETVKLQLGDELDWIVGETTTTYTLPDDWETVETLASIGDIVEYILDSDGYLASVELLGAFSGATAVADSAINEDNNTVTLGTDVYRPTSSSAFFLIDTSGSLSWAAMDWDAFEHYTWTGSSNAVWVTDGTILDYFAIQYDGTFSTSDITTLSGVITGRGVTADGPKLDILTLDEDGDPVEVTYIIADDVTGVTDTTIASRDGYNNGTETDAFTDLDLGEYVAFEVQGAYFVSVTELLAEEFVSGDFTNYIYDYDDESLVVYTTDDLEVLDPDMEGEFILGLECLVFDVTGEAALVGLEDIELEQEIMVFDLTDGGDGIMDVLLILDK